MDIAGVNAAVVEVERFLAAVAAVREWARKDALLPGGQHIHPFYGSRETGALRRASLDLTRALAALRRGK